MCCKLQYNKILAMDKGDSCVFCDMGFLNVAILLIIGTSTLVLIRIFYVIYRSSKPLHSRPPGALSTLIVLGSGSKFFLFLDIFTLHLQAQSCSSEIGNLDK